MKKIHIAGCIILLLLNACKKKNKEPEPIRYTNFKILKITVHSIPFKDKNGEDWDLLDGPDVFYKMETENGQVLFDGTNSKQEDVSSKDLPLNWNFVTAYPITNINVAQFVTLYDYDTFNANDLIGFVGFKLSDYSSDYPKQITKTTGGISITISGEWY